MSADPTRPDWHRLEVPEALSRLGVDPAVGLDAAEVAARREAHGENALAEGRRRGPLRMLLDQFTDFMVLVLIGAAILSGFLGEPEDTVAILLIVTLNAALGFVQEYRAERAMAALHALSAPKAHALRSGQGVDLEARELVPGDVVRLEAGNLVPADLRLVDTAGLRVEEAALTGESVPTEKSTGALLAPELALGDRANLAFKGTVVAHGRGTGVVVATGMSTELGRIASLLDRQDDRSTPLQRRLARFGRRLALVVLALCLGMFAVGLLRGEPPLLMFMTALSLAVAAIPEALPAVVTVSLALGARKMVGQQALVRRLPAVEALGSVTFVCSDKTGTLTRNRMQVEAVWTPDGDPASEALGDALVLCNDATRTPDGARGDPTEVALLERAEAEGRDPEALRAASPRVGEVPFASERASMSTLHAEGGGVRVWTKGAPERVVACCVATAGPDGPAPIDHDAVLARADALAAGGLRVLAFATRTLPAPPDPPTPGSVEEGLTLVGLVGLLDPPRPEAARAVQTCHRAGIRVVMITGDHPATARAIALRLGIVGEEADGVISGPELDRLDDAALAARVEDLRVYARMAPEQKIRIVTALQARGELVAMTGDGVNDAPALRRADIGVAMGRGGTDVAREASAMVLLDDDFATIVAAVREGRRIFDNIRKFVRYTLTSNSGEIWALFLAPLLGLPVPLLPIHILWVNLVTDGLPGLALSLERAERGVMDRPPRPPTESIFAHGLGVHAIWVGMLMGGVTLAVQAWGVLTGHPHWQSMAFTVLTLSQMGHVLAIRSERESFFTLGPGSNPALLGAVTLTLVLQLATLYVPALQEVFGTAALSAVDLGICFAASSVVFFAVELEKAVTRWRS